MSMSRLPPAAPTIRFGRTAMPSGPFHLKGELGPLWPPPPAQKVAGPSGPIARGVDTIKIGDHNMECGYFPARTQIKAGTSVTFTNVADMPHTAIAIKQAQWDTGVLEKEPFKGDHRL